MNNKSSKIIIMAGIVSLLAFSIPSLADANARNRQKKLDQAARHELKKNNSELARDRQDLSNLYRSGASRQDIYRKKSEIRDDLREISRDRWQSGRYNDYRGDRYRGNRYGYGNYGRYDNQRRWGGNNNDNNNGWWNWRRVSDRNHWR